MQLETEEKRNPHFSHAQFLLGQALARTSGSRMPAERTFAERSSQAGAWEPEMMTWSRLENYRLKEQGK